MEVARPEVDAYLLDLIRSHTFAGSDFFELGNGNCRINPDVARPLAATARRWARVLAPHAERVAGVFAANAETMPVEPSEPVEINLPKRFRTPLTQSNRKAKESGLNNVCRSCGKELGKRGRTYCRPCSKERKAEAVGRGREVLNRMRVEGRDPFSKPSTRQRKRQVAIRKNREIFEWETEHGTDHHQEVFDRKIAPFLSDIPNDELVEATGLSVDYCSKIRRGVHVPHARHWGAIRQLIERLEAQGLFDLADDAFEKEIAPEIGEFTPQEIAQAADMSVSYAIDVRRGVKVPRKKYWPGLIQLVTDPEK